MSWKSLHGGRSWKLADHVLSHMQELEKCAIVVGLRKKSIIATSIDVSPAAKTLLTKFP